ncbi:hypothetical protein APY94_06810 [Thermococcus celericrescens]|uniref:DUF835 domain-containing protein n=2 Tax=Thermococcus TaxID=2263 RepID=A0A100XXS2_9EURY|nr:MULTISPECIES: DUF835 domain-containing protein [Thermococcus]KUH33220.1 hypothetical protein APY94_06810 [Thermococcus celericrescens]QEK13840.1 DUF835 domain-containing protein [Thermococcus aciditolerans]
MRFRGRPLKKDSRILDYRRLDEILKKNPNKGKILITRRPPFEVSRPNVYLMWITKVSHPNAVSPSKLHAIEQMVWEQLQDEDVDVILDAIEYLMIENGVEPTLRFVSKLRDMTLLTNSEFYVTVSDGLDSRVLNILRRIVE